MPRTRTAPAAWAAAAVLGAFVVFLLVAEGDGQVRLVVNNVLQTVTAVGAGAVCAVVAWRGQTGRRGGWAFMAAALTGWGLGQAYWSWSEIVADAETPFPSPADVGFLVFPVMAALAVLRFQQGAWRGRAHLRTISDGLIVSTALFIVSWAAVLDTVYSSGDAGDGTAFAVALAYPIGDLVVVALVFRLLAQLMTGRLPMVLLSAGLIAMGVADSGFAYLTTAGTYQTGSVIDVGWVAAFLLCAVAAVADGEAEPTGEVESGVMRLGLFLPLLPFTLGIAVIAVGAWRSSLDHALVVAGGLLMVMIVLRQMLVLAENAHLIATVRQREEELRFQAFHDPLTGLANRLLFRDRLEHAAALRQREGAELTVLFLDLDDFKLVNDRLGHAAGDAVLVGVAERLRASLRQGDTVARLGGDEFAVLLEDDFDDAEQLARRVVDAMRVPFQVGSHAVWVSGSVGLATTSALGDADAVSDRLLQRADIAMYAAKDNGKGSYVLYGEGMRMDQQAAQAAPASAGRPGAR